MNFPFPYSAKRQYLKFYFLPATRTILNNISKRFTDILFLVNDDLERCYMEFITYLKSNYPILCDGSGDAPPTRPKQEENTVLTVESSVPGQGGMYDQNPNGAWWCTML